MDYPVHWPDAIEPAMGAADAAVAAGGGVEPVWILGGENCFAGVVVDAVGGIDEADVGEGH